MKEQQQIVPTYKEEIENVLRGHHPLSPHGNFVKK